MTHKICLLLAWIRAIIEALGKRPDEVRLGRNILRADLA